MSWPNCICVRPSHAPASALTSSASPTATSNATPTNSMDDLLYEDHKGSERGDFKERLQRADQVARLPADQPAAEHGPAQATTARRAQ